MVSSEADVLNKNVSCSVIEVVLYYSTSIHEIVIKFYMSIDSFKYYYRLCIYKYMILYSIQWQASHGYSWSCYAYADKPASI
jgi:hypothetical protein